LKAEPFKVVSLSSVRLENITKRKVRKNYLGKICMKKSLVQEGFLATGFPIRLSDIRLFLLTIRQNSSSVVIMLNLTERIFRKGNCSIPFRFVIEL